MSMNGEAEYVAKKSVWSVITLWRIVSCILIIPIIFLIANIIKNATYRIEFYKDKIVVSYGLISVRRKQTIFMGITGVSVNQSIGGRIFNYGDVLVDVVGRWDVSTTNIHNPKKLEEYLETRVANVLPNNQFVGL